MNGRVCRMCIKLEIRVDRGITVDDLDGSIRSMRMHTEGATRSK